MPLAGHGLRPTTLRRRASRPQLKREPLGGGSKMGPMSGQPSQSQGNESLREVRKASVLWDALFVCVGIYLVITFPQRWWGGALAIVVGALMLVRDVTRLRRQGRRLTCA